LACGSLPFLDEALADGVERNADEVEHDRKGEKDGEPNGRYEDGVQHKTIIAMKVARL